MVGMNAERRIASVLALAATVALLAWPRVGAAQITPDDPDLGRQIEQRFDVLPVQSGVVLRPKAGGAVRSIEVAAGTIAIDGEPVTGAELRQRIGGDADLVLRLSYLSAADQRALFPAGAAPAASPAAGTPPAPGGVPLPAPQVDPGPDPLPDPDPDPLPRSRRSNDVVRIGGNVTVSADERITGDVVAIGGNVEVDGDVSGDVVAIGGNLTLGPNAVINGDAVVVGGQMTRDPKARIDGEVNEIAIGGLNAVFGRGFPRVGGGPFVFGPAFGSAFAFVSTVMRLAIWCLLAAIVLLFARPYVEVVGLRAAQEPAKAGAVGLLIQLLFFPVLLATIVVLVVTIIGIPLLLLVPFAVLAFLVLCFVGFTAAAYDVGRLAIARFGGNPENPYLVAALGIAVVLSPVLIARVLGFGGMFLGHVAWAFVIAGVLAEYLVWTVGLGAVALVRFDRRTSVPVTATTTA